MATYGLSECRYLYGGVLKRLPGAVSISLDPKITVAFDDSRIRGRGNGIRYENVGYDGKLTLSGIPYDFMKDIWKYRIDEQGGYTETYSHGIPVQFALMYQTEGDIARTLLHCCTASKPVISAETNKKGVTIYTAVINIYARANLEGDIRSEAPKGTARFESWFGYGGNSG